ncbi:D-inositol 3-phosphate glycosyltransferase [Gemmata obscuriglobus]|nr:glycosyltransferase family 4 protein [Gemmata obscuriglobus]QEG27299.1 D-inositol 3-phosphate glycosyltransferase [Gemmata obscuriglobus]VTS04113.1 glycosyltransferase (group 1) : Glycosyltransferase (Group 1) OS=Actinoplanes sp. N902-109 GN=L083_7332 PE=4 SV=1: Glycos_transf_1 [Gemmata obscuriglobus UQM 2246]
MSHPRVVHVTPALFGEGGVFGGAERYSLELARHMAKVVPTALVAFGDEPRRFTTPEGLRVRVLGPAWRVRGQAFNRFHSGVVRAVAGADVVHCHQPRMLASEVCALLARATGRRAFASDLGAGGWGFSSRLNTDGWFHGHLHISEYSRQVAGHVGRPGAGVIYGGVNTDLFAPDSSVPREPLVVFVGRLMPHKGVDVLIDALPGGMDLELIGRPYHERFFADLKRLAAGKRVTFRPDCGDDDIVRAYRRAACVVLPSLYRDCYGNESKVPELLGQTLIEGMACGAPGICTAVASLPEVVTDGETGFVVPPNDPSALRARLEFLRDNATAVGELGRAARTRVLNHFTWGGTVMRCLEAYAAG